MAAKRGSGTIQERIDRLTGRLSADQVSSAREIATKHDLSVIKLASYLSSTAAAAGRISAPATIEADANVSA